MNATHTNSREALLQAKQTGLINGNNSLVLGKIAEAEEAGAFLTASEIAKRLSMDKSKVTPRLRDLELLDIVRKRPFGKRMCTVTGYNASTYQMTGRSPKPIIREKTVPCYACSGSGKQPA